jgi:hypothetical protein
VTNVALLHQASPEAIISVNVVFFISNIPLEFPAETLGSLAGFFETRERLKQLVVSPVVFIENDTVNALINYLQLRAATMARKKIG